MLYLRNFKTKEEALVASNLITPSISLVNNTVHNIANIGGESTTFTFTEDTLESGNVEVKISGEPVYENTFTSWKSNAVYAKPIPTTYINNSNYKYDIMAGNPELTGTLSNTIMLHNLFGISYINQDYDMSGLSIKKGDLIVLPSIQTADDTYFTDLFSSSSFLSSAPSYKYNVQTKSFDLTVKSFVFSTDFDVYGTATTIYVNGVKRYENLNQTSSEWRAGVVIDNIPFGAEIRIVQTETNSMDGTSQDYDNTYTIASNFQEYYTSKDIGLTMVYYGFIYRNGQIISFV